MRRPRGPQVADDLLRPVAVVHIKVNNRYPFYALVPTPHGQRVRGADGDATWAGCAGGVIKFCAIEMPLAPWFAGYASSACAVGIFGRIKRSAS